MCIGDGTPDERLFHMSVARTETTYMDDSGNAATEETATRFVICDYDAEGNLIRESFGFIDRDAASDLDDPWTWQPSRW